LVVNIWKVFVVLENKYRQLSDLYNLSWVSKSDFVRPINELYVRFIHKIQM